MKTNRINVIMKTDEHLERLISIRQNVHNTVSELISQDLAEIYKEKSKRKTLLKVDGDTMSERNIKKKVITKQEEYDIKDTHYIETYYHCPVCGECFGNVKLSEVKHFNYCYICGQRLDWGD